MCAGHLEAVSLDERHKGNIILGRWAELLGELPGSQVMLVTRAGGVIKLAQQAVERFLVAQRQAEGQVQPVGWGQPLAGLQMAHGSRHMAPQNLSLCPPTCSRKQAGAADQSD